MAGEERGRLGSSALEPHLGLLSLSSCSFNILLRSSVLGTSEFEDFILLVPQCLGPRCPSEGHRTEDCSLLHPRGARVETCILLRYPADEGREKEQQIKAGTGEWTK